MGTSPAARPPLGVRRHDADARVPVCADDENVGVHVPLERAGSERAALGPVRANALEAATPLKPAGGAVSRGFSAGR
jgi:hypothetical protein